MTAMPSSIAPLPQARDDTLLAWTRRAEAKEPFDLFAKTPIAGGFCLTRARFDGKALWIGHWIDRSIIALLEMRQASDGSWMVHLDPRGHLLTGMGNPEAHAWADLLDAFAASPPTRPCGWAARLAWPRSRA